MYSYALENPFAAKSFCSTNYDKLISSSFIASYNDNVDISDCEFILVAVSKNIYEIFKGEIKIVNNEENN
jgi:hypothetical protein